MTTNTIIQGVDDIELKRRSVRRRFRIAISEIHPNVNGDIKPRELPFDDFITADGPFAFGKVDRASGGPKPLCHWYHLPTNNMCWVKDLFKKELKIEDIWEVFTSTIRHSSYPHGRYISPDAKPVRLGDHQILAVFMPYMSYEARERHKQRTARLRRRSGISDKRDEEELDEQLLDHEEESLYEAWLNHERPLHIRRTLDQYHYHMLDDTRTRDDDQVVLRFQEKKGIKPPDQRLLMVDQLWIWHVKGNGDHPDRVFSCFTEIDSCGTGGLGETHKRILQRLSAQAATSAAEVVAIIMGACADLFVASNDSVMLRFFTYFQDSVDLVNVEELKLMETFRFQTKCLYDLNKQHWAYQKESDKISGELFDIEAEMDLLEEVKDIRDEIKIIKRVIAQQRQVLEDPEVKKFMRREAAWGCDLAVSACTHGTDMQSTGEAISGNDAVQRPRLSSQVHDSMESSWTTTTRVDDDDSYCAKGLRMLKSISNDFHNMDVRAKDAYDTVYHLIDLKQKQGNIWEARCAREDGRATAAQSNVMVVFTAVTIIFLPLSFMASFFALNVAQFPSNAAGNVQWSLHRVTTLLFSVSLSVSAVFIAFAAFYSFITSKLYWTSVTFALIVLKLVRRVWEAFEWDIPEPLSSRIKELEQHQQAYRFRTKSEDGKNKKIEGQPGTVPAIAKDHQQDSQQVQPDNTHSEPTHISSSSSHRRNSRPRDEEEGQ